MSGTLNWWLKDQGFFICMWWRIRCSDKIHSQYDIIGHRGEKKKSMLNSA